MVLTRSQRKKRELEQKRQGKSNATESSESTDESSSSPQPPKRQTTNQNASKRIDARHPSGRMTANRSIKRQTSSNDNIDAPSVKTPLSKIVVNLPTNQLDQYLSHLNIFNKTDSTFRV